MVGFWILVVSEVGVICNVFCEVDIRVRWLLLSLFSVLMSVLGFLIRMFLISWLSVFFIVFF